MKITTIILSLFYLLSVVGYGVEFHYCLGRVTDVNLDWVGTSCSCDAAHVEQQMKCCDELSIQVQVDEEHQSSGVDVESTKAPMEVVQTITSGLNDSEKSQNVLGTPMDNGPPEQPLYLKHCALILYC